MSLCTVKNVQNLDPEVVPPTAGVTSGWVLTNVSGEPEWAAASSGGTVTSITAGTGITCTPNPITTTGTISSTALDSIATRNWKAGSSSTVTGVDNVVIGDGADGGGTAVAIGSGAGSATLANSVAVGYLAGSAGGTGTFVGYESGLYSTGLGNVGVGSFALQIVSTGTQNTAVGISSGPSANVDRTTSIGSTAACGAADDVCVGYGSRSFGVSVSVGSGAGSTTALQSVCIGYQSGDASNGAVTSVGYRAARGAAVSNGTFIGHSAGINVTGVGNTIMGVGSGTTLTTGTSNTIIGNGADVSSAAITAGTALGTAAIVGGSENVMIGFNGISTGTNGTALGARASATNTKTLAVGWTSNANSVNSSAIGADATASASGASCFGQGSSASGTNGTALGQGSTASASYSTAIGVGVSNGTASTTLIGDGSGSPTAHIVESTGFLKSRSWYSCKAGRSSGTQVVTFPGPVTLTINNTVWTSGCAVSGNNITMPQANTQFSVNACTLINAVGSPAPGTVVMRIRYYDGTTTSTLTQCTLTTNSTTPAGASWCCSGTLQTPNVTTAYVFAELERLAGSVASVDITNWQLTVKRDA